MVTQTPKRPKNRKIHFGVSTGRGTKDLFSCPENFQGSKKFLSFNVIYTFIKKNSPLKDIYRGFEVQEFLSSNFRLLKHPKIRLGTALENKKSQPGDSK